MTFPTFISDTELLFMSRDNILFTVDLTKNFEEKSSVSQCWYPGVTGKIELSTVIREGLSIMGENCLIYEKVENFYGPGLHYERVLPNFYNQYFSKDQVIFDKKTDEVDEMRYIQINYKNKIQMMPKQQFGYIYQNKRDEMDIRDTSVRVVNTFNFFYWRLMGLLKKKVYHLDEISTEHIQELSYTQIPNGQTYLHLIMKNENLVKEMFERVKKTEIETEDAFYLPIFEDQNEKTVIDYLFGKEFKSSKTKHGPTPIKVKNQVQNLFDVKDEGDAEDDDDMQAVQQAGFFILEQIGNYPFDLFKINFDNVLPNIVKADVNRFCAFVDSRSKQLSFLKNIDSGNIMNEKVTIFTETNLW
mmetsp:Transcript_23093/g.22503  ORF Transcript_23093/g.22503 Transcript_23093/m.22503 type:complete len:358 (+) Transcript_23093:178-1251(+)